MGDVGGASYLFGDEVTVVKSFEEESGKLSSARIKRSVGGRSWNRYVASGVLSTLKELLF